MSSQGNSSSETSHGAGTLPGCPMTPSKSASPDSGAGGTQDSTDTESVPCLSPAPSSLSLQQNTNSSCVKTNQVCSHFVFITTAKIFGKLMHAKLMLGELTHGKLMHAKFMHEKSIYGKSMHEKSRHGKLMLRKYAWKINTWVINACKISWSMVHKVKEK